MSTPQAKTVYTLVDRGRETPFYIRIGSGYVQKDGSVNIKLDAFPVNGILQVRDYATGDLDVPQDTSLAKCARAAGTAGRPQSIDTLSRAKRRSDEPG